MVLVRLMERSDLAPTCACWLGSGGLNSGTMVLDSASILGGSCPDSCPSSPHLEGSQLSSSSYVSGAVWALTCTLEPRGVNLREQVHVQTIRRSTWDPSNPLSHLDVIPDDFHCQMLWGLLFLALVAWAGVPGMRLGPLAALADLFSWDIPPILNHHTMDRGVEIQNSQCLHPSYQFNVAYALYP